MVAVCVFLGGSRHPRTPRPGCGPMTGPDVGGVSRQGQDGEPSRTEGPPATRPLGRRMFSTLGSAASLPRTSWASYTAGPRVPSMGRLTRRFSSRSGFKTSEFEAFGFQMFGLSPALATLASNAILRGR